VYVYIQHFTADHSLKFLEFQAAWTLGSRVWIPISPHSVAVILCT